VKLQASNVSNGSSSASHASLGAPRYRSAWQCTSHILRTEGIPGLYRGATSSFIGVAVESSLLFGSYTQIKTALQNGERAVPTAGTVATAAGLAGGLISFVLCPTELVKCRLQVQAQSPALSPAASVYTAAAAPAAASAGASKRVSAMSRLTPSFAAAAHPAPFSTNAAFPSLARTPAAAATSAAAAAAATSQRQEIHSQSPLQQQALMQQQQQQRVVGSAGHYKGPWDCVVQTVKADGVTTALRESLGNIGFFLTYEAIKHRLSYSPPPCLSLLSPSFVLQPQGLFRGLAATALRESLGNIGFFLTYEAIKHRLLPVLAPSSPSHSSPSSSSSASSDLSVENVYEGSSRDREASRRRDVADGRGGEGEGVLRGREAEGVGGASEWRRVAAEAATAIASGGIAGIVPQRRLNPYQAQQQPAQRSPSQKADLPRAGPHRQALDYSSPPTGSIGLEAAAAAEGEPASGTAAGGTDEPKSESRSPPSRSPPAEAPDHSSPSTGSIGLAAAAVAAEAEAEPALGTAAADTDESKSESRSPPSRSPPAGAAAGAAEVAGAMGTEANTSPNGSTIGTAVAAGAAADAVAPAPADDDDEVLSATPLPSDTPEAAPPVPLPPTPLPEAAAPDATVLQRSERASGFLLLVDPKGEAVHVAASPPIPPPPAAPASPSAPGPAAAPAVPPTPAAAAAAATGTPVGGASLKEAWMEMGGGMVTE
ncbi:unnamed protein product, partial [Closterium sp. NIES-54]